MSKLFRNKILILVLSLIATLSIFVGLGALTVKGNEEKKVEIVACNLSFQDSVKIMYAVDSENIAKKSGIKILIWEQPQEIYEKGREDYTLSFLRGEEINGKEYSIFMNSKVMAKQMTDDFYAMPYYDDNGTPVYGKLVKYSVIQYAKNMYGTNKSDYKLDNLIKGMLEYGALTQIYFDYKLDRLANASYFEIDVEGALLPDGRSYGLFAENEKITLTAGEKEGYEFSHWESSVSGTLGSEKSFVYTVTASDEIRAVYEEVYYTVSVSLVSSENGSIKNNGEGFTAKEFTNVLKGSEIKVEGNTLTIGSTIIVGGCDDSYSLFASVEDGLTKVTKNLTIQISFIKKLTLNWGEAKINNGIVNYISEDGTTSTLITGDSKSWLKEESFDNPVWYGIDNGGGIFEDGSKFSVRWIQQNSSDFDDLSKEMDISGGKVEMFLTVGLINPSGDEYQNLQDKVDLYIELGEDWDKEDLKLFAVGEDGEEVEAIRKSVLGPDGIERDFAVLSLRGNAKFAVLNLNHF